MNDYMYQFHDVVIRPFSELFNDLFLHFAAKVKMTIIYLFIMAYDLAQSTWTAPHQTAVQLLDTPTEYWVGLFILTAIDFFFGSIRAATEPDIQWDWKVFARGGFKFVLYAGALIVSATATNMFPVIFGLFQYAVVAILAAYETVSAFRNMKLLAILHAAIEFIQNKRDAVETFKDIIERKDKELMRKAQRSKTNNQKEKQAKNEADKG